MEKIYIILEKYSNENNKMGYRDIQKALEKHNIFIARQIINRKLASMRSKKRIKYELQYQLSKINNTPIGLGEYVYWLEKQ